VAHGLRKFTEHEWAPKYREWVRQINAADVRDKIDWDRLLQSSRLVQDDHGDFVPPDNTSENGFEELPDEVPFENDE